MVRPTSQGGHSPWMCGFRFCCGRHAHTCVWWDGGVREVQQRPLRVAGVTLGVEKVKASASAQRTAALPQAGSQFHNYWK